MPWAAILWWAQEVVRWWGYCPGWMKMSMKNGSLTRPGKSNVTIQEDVNYFVNFADELQQHFIGQLLPEGDGVFCFTVSATILVPHVEESYACLTFAYTRCVHILTMFLYILSTGNYKGTCWLSTEMCPDLIHFFNKRFVFSGLHMTVWRDKDSLNHWSKMLRVSWHLQPGRTLSSVLLEQ